MSRSGSPDLPAMICFQKQKIISTYESIPIFIDMLYQFLQIFHCYRNSKFILGAAHLAFYSGAAVSFRIGHFRYYPSAATFQQKTRLVGGGSESRKILCIIYSQTSVPMANDDRCHSGFVFSVLYFVSLVNIFLYQILYLIIVYISF